MPKYTAIIERPDGTTYYQMCSDLEQLESAIGPDYWIVDYFEN